MGKGTNKAIGKPSELSPEAFGTFTPDHVREMLRSYGKSVPDWAVTMAATCLATINPHGPNPGSELIATSMDLLANAGTPTANDLLWQAAEHAANWRIRVEAIKRCGPSAQSVERRQALRKWAAEGFAAGASFQNEQFSVDIPKEAAITAMGNLSDPDSEDIDILIDALTPHSKSEKFSSRVFKAATDAYWSIGSPASLPKLVGLLTSSSHDVTGLIIISLAAKFSANNLKPNADALRKAFRDHAQHWQEDQVRTDRLVDLGKKLATEEFLQQWSSSYGRDEFAHGRGRITSIMLKTLDHTSEGVANSLLVLARSPGNVIDNSDVVRGLQTSARAGHGKIIAMTVLSENHEGHNRLIQSGRLFKLYPSMGEAVKAVCEAIGSRANLHDQRNVATKVAMGLLVARSQGLDEANEAALDFELLNRRRSHQQQRCDQECLAANVERLGSIQQDQNPVALVARLVSPPVSSPGAAAIIENWLRPDDILSHYAMRVVVREAGRSDADPANSPMLNRLEQYILKPDGQQPVLRQPLEQALIAEVVVEGRINRYGLDLMQREKLAFEHGASLALPRLQCMEDADFLLARLVQQGQQGLGVLIQAVSFHRSGEDELTAHVQAKAIESSVALLRATGDENRVEAFARELHQRFQDLPIVREVAYRACGLLGSFVSIKPLKDRLQKERVSSARDAITESITALREKLMRSKPEQETPEEIKLWLSYVADLSDPAVLPQVVGYLHPPHSDHSVRCASLHAIANMKDPRALEAVMRFIDDTEPDGETLTVARRARLILEERNDADLFDVLAIFFDPNANVMDPANNYEHLFGVHLLSGVTGRLKKAQKLWEDGHWDEFITQANGVMEALVRQIFRTKCTAMGLEQKRGDNLARGISYTNMLNTTEFRNTFSKLQAHCNTIQSFRSDSPTAHAMNEDGTAKVEATEEEAECVRREFSSSFAEAVKALR